MGRFTRAIVTIAAGSAVALTLGDTAYAVYLTTAAIAFSSRPRPVLLGTALNRTAFSSPASPTSAPIATNTAIAAPWRRYAGSSNRSTA